MAETPLLNPEAKAEDPRPLVLEALKLIHGASTTRWDKRRGYEWTLSYAVWTALAGFFAVVALGKDSLLHNPPVLLTVPCLAGIFLVHLFYLWIMASRTIEDLKTQKTVEDNAFMLVTGVLLEAKPAAQESCWYGALKHHLETRDVLPPRLVRRYGVVCPIIFTFILALIAGWGAFQTNTSGTLKNGVSTPAAPVKPTNPGSAVKK